MTYTAIVKVYDPTTNEMDNKDRYAGTQRWCGCLYFGRKNICYGWLLGNRSLTVIEECAPEVLQSSVSPQGKFPATWGETKKQW